MKECDVVNIDMTKDYSRYLFCACYYYLVRS